MGKHPLEFSFDRVFHSFWDPYILKTDYGGSLFKYLTYFLLAAFLPIWGPTFHDTAFSTLFVGIEPDILRFTNQPFLGILSLLMALNSIQHFQPVRIGAKLAFVFWHTPL